MSLFNRKNKILDENKAELEKEDSLKNKEEEKTDSMGVTVDEYDIIPEIETKEEDIDILSTKESIDVEYTFNGEEVKEGLRIYQKETLYKKNTIFTLILAVIFGIYLYNAIRKPGEFLSSFLAVLCIIVIAYLWYLPYKHLKSTAKAADENDLSFKMNIYDDCVRISESESQVILKYNLEITKIIETDSLFLLCVGKERLFILPKHCFEDENREKAKDIFKNVMGEKYLEKFSKK